MSAQRTFCTNRCQKLWEGQIPRGFVTLAEGPSSYGKTTFMTDLIASATTGRAMPGDEPKPPMNAIILTEDDLAMVAAPRLTKAGADLTKVKAIPTSFTTGGVFDLDKHLDGLVAAVRETDASMILLDPFVMATRRNMNDYAESVAVVGGQLGEIAKELNVAIVAVRHHGKGSGSAEKAGIGSTGVYSSARSVLAFGPHPDYDKDRRVFVMYPVKQNLGKNGPAYGYEIEDAWVTGRTCRQSQDQHLKPESSLAQ